MTNKPAESPREKLNATASHVRERIFALFCLTIIAIVSMYQISDPENIVINIIVGICSFVGGVASERMRKADSPKE